jgi:beta-lactamase class D
MVSNMQLHAQNFDAIRGFNGCVVMINVKTSDSLIYNQMLEWIRKIGYGDCNTKSGIDIFWLPRKGKTSILISPMEQALLIKKLVNGKLGFSAESKSLLKKIALSLVTNNGRMYGKTGSGENVGKENNNIGWFVGLVESNRGSFAFACLIKGKRASGKIAKQIMTQVLMNNQYI